MKKYRVISYFTDLRDYDHAYNVGDEFPRQGVTVDEKRLDELSSSRNKQHRPLIEAVEDYSDNKKAQNGNPDSANSENTEESGAPEQTANPDAQGNPEQSVTPDVSVGSKKYSKEEIDALKLPQIRDLAGTLGFKISSTSKDKAVVEFMEKQG